METFNNMAYPFDCTFHLPLCITNTNCKHIHITRIGEIPTFIDQCDLECTEITSVKNTLNKRHVFAECYHLNAWNGVTILRCPQQVLWLCLHVPNHILTFKFKCWHNCTHYLRLSLYWVKIFNCICMNRMTLMVSLLLIYKYEKSPLMAICTIGEDCLFPHRKARDKVGPTTRQSDATKKNPSFLKLFLLWIGNSSSFARRLLWACIFQVCWSFFLYSSFLLKSGGEGSFITSTKSRFSILISFMLPLSCPLLQPVLSFPILSVTTTVPTFGRSDLLSSNCITVASLFLRIGEWKYLADIFLMRLGNSKTFQLGRTAPWITFPLVYLFTT